ncbi:MAG: 23S rRNA (uracil(1939)-C(5))-methyltransferase RlmD [Betaproteobacteria bacterium]
MGGEVELEIESLDLEGRGVAHRDGKVIFVEGALPGERVRATTLRAKPSYETARTTALLRASAQRVVPRCPHFGFGPGACGGCAMQHLAPRAQLAIKQRVLEDALWHVGRVRPEQVLRPVAGPDWHYRYRARLSVRYVARKGGVLVGFHERASSYVADMRECHVLPEKLSALLLPLRELIGGMSGRDRLPQIEVAVTADGTTVLVLRHLQPLTAGDRARLRDFAQRHGVVWWLQPGGPDTAAPLEADSPRALTLALPEHAVAIPFGPTDFTQVNHAINEVLVRRAVELLGPRADEHVLDLFCGLGNFSLPLARRAARVTGVEGSAVLVRRARAAAVANGLAAQADFAAANLFEWTSEDLARIAAERGAVGAALIDPPREGALTVARVFAAARQPPRRIVYVSCNPATLARDCAVLVHEGGWRLRAAGVVNMFPHTAHVESIAVLEPATC